MSEKNVVLVKLRNMAPAPPLMVYDAGSLHQAIINEMQILQGNVVLEKKLVHVGYSTRGAREKALMTTWIWVYRQEGVEDTSAVCTVWGEDPQDMGVEVAKLTGGALEVSYLGNPVLSMPSGESAGYRSFSA